MKRFEITFNLRYGVIGIYVDRTKTQVHIYPLPFIRLTISRVPS